MTYLSLFLSASIAPLSAIALLTEFKTPAQAHFSLSPVDRDIITQAPPPAYLIPSSPSLEPPGEIPLPRLPPPNELLYPIQPIPEAEQGLPSSLPITVQVQRFEVICRTAFVARINCQFEEELLATIAKQAVNDMLLEQPAEESGQCPQIENINAQIDRPLSFNQVLQARAAITAYYNCHGFVTSGAFIPEQVLNNGIVTIQVIEGSLEEIHITGTQQLNDSYIRDRLRMATEPPLNIHELLKALQLLQIDPLIHTISADLQAGIRPGTSLLQVEVAEANTFSTPINIDNGRSPSVGSFRQQMGISEANLLGLGDSISISYTRTEGSNQFDGRYTIPINARNGTLSAMYSTTSSNVIEEPFDTLEIESESRYYEFTYRQPISQSLTTEFALGLIASRQENQTFLGVDNIGPFPLSAGADDEGRTHVSALRFFQEWTQRSDRQVFALRSQFSLGLDLLNATVNESVPDSRFFSWRGQGQWVRLLAPDTLLVARTDLQLTPDSLLALEQIGLGGQATLRGYRQNALLTDNGLLFSTEVRLPIARISRIDGLLQLIPFVDAGIGWNTSASDPANHVLLGTGLGLFWRMGNNFTARLDYGIPLIDIGANSEEASLQGDGFYFSLSVSPF